METRMGENLFDVTDIKYTDNIPDGTRIGITKEQYIEYQRLKDGVKDLIRIMKNDVELNKRMDVKRTENENDVIYSCSRRTYDPELVVKALEILV